MYGDARGVVVQRSFGSDGNRTLGAIDLMTMPRVAVYPFRESRRRARRTLIVPPVATSYGVGFWLSQRSQSLIHPLADLLVGSLHDVQVLLIGVLPFVQQAVRR